MKPTERELIAARDHDVAGCPVCQAAAARLGQTEVMFPVGSAGGVTELRTGAPGAQPPRRRSPGDTGN